MKLIRNIIITLLMPILLSSCGELFGFADYQSPEAVIMSHNLIDIAVGDSIIFDTKVIPDTLPVDYLWTMAGDTNSIELVGRRLLAKIPGQVMVYVEVKNASSLADSITTETASDSCLVNIFEWSECDKSEFLYETILYASLEIDGQSYTDTLGMADLVAVVDGEIRAHAVEREVYVEKIDAKVSYLEMRILSHWPGETASIECYHRGKYQHYIFQEIQLNGGVYGTLSNLVALEGISKY